MIELKTLLLFCAAVVALLLSPGPNMAFLLSHGVSHGVRGGLAVAMGIFAADLVLTALTATGIAAAINAWPPSFDVLRYLGALYLLGLAVQAVRSRGVAQIEEKRHPTTWNVFRMATLNSLLNPKALLFFMVFLPQFVVPAKGQIPLQLTILGLTLSVIALIFHGALGLASGKLAVVFMGRTGLSRYLGWLHATLFVGLAARLVLLDRPGAR